MRMLLAQADPTVEDLAESSSSMLESLVDALPRIGAGAGVLVVAVIIAIVARALLRRWFCRSHSPSFAQVMSKLTAWLIVGAGILLAVTVIFPSVKPVDLLAGAGIFSVAIGFAFKDILENLFAGVLLLFREPFSGGDQIEVNGQEGTVERITVRETRIKTYDGRRVLIPNADVYTNAIVVNTAFESRRLSFIVGVAYETDLDQARQTIVDALGDVSDVADDPPPEALLVELAASTINIEARFWTSPQKHETRATIDKAIAKVKRALDEADIELPCDIIALQATSSLGASLEGVRVSPGGSVVEAKEYLEAVADSNGDARSVQSEQSR